MKSIASSLLFILVFSSTAFSQTYLEIQENSLLNCCNPTNSAIKKYSDAQIKSSFKYLMDTLKFEYRYVYGACENRAHFMSVALKKKGIENKKIWCFAPIRYSFISQKQMSVKDPLKITETVVWSYHVAPIVIRENSDTLVIDPSLSNIGPINYKDWLKALNCPEAVYNFSDCNWYLFNSFDGFKAFNNFNNEQPLNISIPKWFPNVMTGDFMEYDASTQNIPSGLATNDIAMRIYLNERQSINSDDFKKILGNINNIIAFITDTTNNTITNAFKTQYQTLVNKYSAEYKIRKDFWNNTFSLLNR